MAITEGKLNELLKYSETNICDFKEQIYHIENEASKVSFLKDVLSMANTIRYEPAYIIVGVRQKDGHNEFFDVDPNIDENNFLTFIKSNVGPHYPYFNYCTFKYKKHQIGVFEIGISKSGPFVSKKAYGDKVKAGQVYYRYGSSNTEADEAKKQEIIRWMKDEKNDNFKLVSKQLELENQDQYNYILFFGEDHHCSEQQLKIIANTKWAMIVDLTRDTFRNGLYHYFNNDRISKHDITPEVERIPRFYEEKSLFWYLAPNTNKSGTDKIDTRAWIMQYSRSVDNCISKVVESSKKEIIIVSMFTGDNKNASINNIVFQNYNNPLFRKYVDISCNEKFSINDESATVEITCLCDDVCKALSQNRKTYFEDDYILMENDSYSVTSPAWIHEEMEPLYVNIENMEEFNSDYSVSYFQGRDINWNELNPCIAAERKKYKELIYQISESLKRKSARTDLIKVDYDAGAGVTTVLRMIAWHFHDINPVVLLKHYTNDGTRERLRSLAADVKRSRILLVIDIHDFDSQLVSELMRSLDVDNTPVTILYSRRHMGGGVDNYLEEQLKGNEISAFEKIYSNQIDYLSITTKEKDERKELIYSIKKSGADLTTPFVYALSTFGDSFIKLSDYVREHLGTMNDSQKEVLTFISTVHYYTGLEVPLVILNKCISKDQKYTIKKYLSKGQYSLLIFNSEGVKTLHHSVSGEILKQICSYKMVNEKAWKNKLQDVFLFVINELASYKSNDMSIRIIKALFLDQQPSKDTGGDEQRHFSYAIEDLPDNIFKKKVLEKLCVVFNQNPYVYSNMARYYHYIENNEDIALDYIQKALEIDEDYTFYHLKGIALAKKMRDYVQNNQKDILDDYKAFVRKVYDVLDDIEFVYGKSVELNVNNIAALTSKLNFLLSIIRDVQKSTCPNNSISDMLRSEKYSWCNDYISKAHETIEEIHTIDLYMNMNHEEDIANYENQILVMEGNISDAIIGWNNLLSKADIYHPTIRNNLLHGYYQQCGKNWKGLEKSKYEHVRQLIMDNIQEQPEDARNIEQWFDFARDFEGDLEKTTEYFMRFVSNPGLGYYYRAMLTFFAYGIENDDITYLNKGIELSKKCEDMAREKPNRRVLRDVINIKRKNLKKIVKFKDYLSLKSDFNEALSLVPKISGCISSIEKPEVGWLKVDKLGITIKFNPSFNSNRIYRQTRDEGVKVEFVLGFRTEGVFAFNVTDALIKDDNSL